MRPIHLSASGAAVGFSISRHAAQRWAERVEPGLDLPTAGQAILGFLAGAWLVPHVIQGQAVARNWLWPDVGVVIATRDGISLHVATVLGRGELR